jgi:uncharacterized membrane protein
MSSSDAFWLSIWEVLATIGFIIVIIGVVIEGVEHFAKFAKKEHSRKLRIEKLGWFLVVLGLAMEFLGDHAAKRISDREAARLNAEAGDARRIAGDANERAANTESNNLVLQAKLKTRIITEDERKEFIECLRGQPRGVVKISFDRGAAANVRFYAEEIANLLIAAGYSVPGGADICDVKPILPADTSIEVWAKSQNDGPAYFFPLANCLSDRLKIQNGWNGVKIRQAWLEENTRKV